MNIFFVTGNENKFLEVKSMLPSISLEQLKVDLPEIQEMDLEEVVKAKLLGALKHCEGPVIVEDTGLYMECLSGLPGPLIKWFEERLGLEGMASICDKLGEDKAIARTIIGYAESKEKMFFFEGKIKGCIVKPRKGNGFGWDAIFVPEKHDKAFSEMSNEEKNRVSMRRKALEKLKSFLENPEDNH
jgi:inosine triphosphate pyrophosphatase